MHQKSNLNSPEREHIEVIDGVPFIDNSVIPYRTNTSS